MIDGIPRLLPPEEPQTIDPSALRIKTKEEAARTIAEMTRTDSGFIRSPRAFYAVYLALVLFAVLKWMIVVGVVVVVLAADWFFFRRHRASVLDRALRSSLRLRTSADHRAVDEVYKRLGKDQPGMSDWVQLARESLGGSPASEGAGELDDERYGDIVRVYGQRAHHTDVVIDVGANDGRAHSRFGIGRGATFIGIDVSHLLLKEFRKNIPEQTAVQADGACLPLQTGVADFLFCTETLEHIADPNAAVAEFVRVLKPGGRLMVQSPNAHRIRNLNIFHLLTLPAGFVTDGVLQKKTVHENTWHNAVTYHWDFSRQDYKRMLEPHPCRVVELYSRSFFFPGFLIRGRIDRYRRKERALSSIPVVRLLGDDLVVVAEKL